MENEINKIKKDAIKGFGNDAVEDFRDSLNLFKNFPKPEDNEITYESNLLDDLILLLNKKGIISDAEFNKLYGN